MSCLFIRTFSADVKKHLTFVELHKIVKCDYLSEINVLDLSFKIHTLDTFAADQNLC